MPYLFTPCDPSEAYPLYWAATEVPVTKTFTTFDGEYGTTTVHTVAETITVQGLQSTQPTAPSLAFIPGWAGYEVVDNKIMKVETSKHGTYHDTVITATGGTRLVTSRAVEGFSLTLMLPALFGSLQTGYVPVTVEVGIYYRVLGSAGAWHCVHPNFAIVGVQRSEILRDITVAHCADGLNQYEILVVRVTPDNSNFNPMNVTDTVYVKDLTEIIYSSVAYNHTALLGVKIRATDQLSGQPPAVTCIVHGTKVQVPSNLVEAYKTRYDAMGNYIHTPITAAYTAGWTDGQLGTERVWTDNPVWCLYDLLTNTRYGLGDYYKISETKRGLMLANFYLMAKYCDEPIQYTDTDGAVAVNLYRPRFALNMVIDQSKSAIEWITQICALMRANMYYTEGVFWIDIDRPKQMSQLFNMTNIKDYNQTSTSFREIANCYEVQWVNPALDYVIDSFRLEDEVLQADNTVEERKKALTLVGSTNFDQAKSLAKYALLAGKHCTKMVTFKTGTDGLRSMVGDVVGIQHDVPMWGWGGKVAAYDVVTRTVTLSAPINPTTGLSLVLAIKTIPTTSIQEIPIVSAAWDGTDRYEVVLASAPTRTPEVGDTYIIGRTDASVAPFRITSIKRSEDDEVEVTAIEYQEQIYAMCDDASDSSIFTSNNYSLLPDIKRISVSGVYASVKVYQDTSGAFKVGVDVFYTVPTRSAFWKSAQVWWTKAGNTAYSTMIDNNVGHFFIEDIAESGEYQIVVTSIYTNGKQSISDALNDHENHPFTTIMVDTYLPNDIFREGVTGLTIENRANDGTFVGRDCVVVWKKPVALDAQANTVAGSIASGSTDSWVGTYEVKVTGKASETKRVQAGVVAERYVYTHEMNHQDSQDGDADRLFTISVTAIDKVGRRSKTKSIECYNPAPVKIEAS